MSKLLGVTCMLGMLAGGLVQSEPLVTDLQAFYRDGQVFLTWREEQLPDAATLSVYSHNAPITTATLGDATLLASGIHRGSARDWWRDRASFGQKNPSDPPVGFVIETGGAELPPQNGLHVHTVSEKLAGSRYYAVTWRSPQEEGKLCEQGKNSLSQPLTVSVAQRGVVWLGDAAKAPQRGAGKNKPLIMRLHGRGGGAPSSNKRDAFNCLYFADAKQGWREGLPFKFQLSVNNDLVAIDVQERIWVNRAVMESPDSRDYCPTQQSFYLGYNVNIAQTIRTPEIVFDNYQEKYILGLLDWAAAYLGTDVNRVYFQGGSMGGSGSVSMALHFPERIAAVHALVPIYAYTWKKGPRGGMSASRLLCMCGPVDKTPVRMVDGGDFFEYLDGAKNIARRGVDFPPIFATNGRQDLSIPWPNNPPFFKAANEAKQALAVYWNNGDHGMSSQAPADVKHWGDVYRKYRLNLSYPVFTDCSDNRDYGDGDCTKGDLVGWINRGLDWEVLEDSAAAYRLKLSAAHPDMTYPVSFTLTIRRLQQFKVKPGDVVTVKIGETVAKVTIGADGLLTVPQVNLPSAKPVVVAMSK